MQEIVATLLRLASADAERYARAKQRNVMLYVFATVSGITAYMCLVAAGVLLLARWSDPLLAATFVAAAFGALALIVLAIVATLNRRDRQWMQERRAVYSNSLVTLAGSALGPGGLALVAAAVLAGMIYSTAAPGDDEPPPAP